MIQASRNRSQRQVISTTPRHRTAIVNSLVRPRMRRALGANSTQRAIGPILAQALRHLQVASEDAQSPVPRMIRNDTQVAVPIDPLTREETNGLIRITNDILQLVQEGAQLERNRATAPEARHVPTANPVQPAQAEPPPRAQRPRRRMERRKRRDKAGQKRRQRTQTWVATFVQGLVALAAIIRDAARPLTESVGKLCKTGLELIVRGVDKVILRDDYKILFGNVSKIQASRVFKTLLVAGAGGIVYVKWDDLSHGLLTAPDTVRRAFERHELRSRPIYESTGTIDPEPASLFEAVAAEAMSTSATSDPEVTDILDMLFPRGIWVPRDEASAALRQSLLVKSREEYLTTHEMRDYLVSTLFASQPLARSHTDALLATPGEVVPQQVVRDLEEFDWDMWPKTRALLEPARIALENEWRSLRQEQRDMSPERIANMLLNMSPRPTRWIWKIIEERCSGNMRQDDALMTVGLVPDWLNALQTLPAHLSPVLLAMAYQHQAVLAFAGSTHNT